MMRIHQLITATLFSTLLVATFTSSVADSPNILVIFSDDQGMNDVSCYGSEIPTPNIDRIAKEGIRFDSWYVASSICTPSRFGLLTGQYPSRSQDQLLGALMFLGEEDRHRGLQVGEKTIASVLSAAGYRTALIGKWHLGHGDKRFLPTQHGFQTFVGHTGGCIDYFTMRYGVQQDWYRNEEHENTVGYATDVITNEANRFLQQQSDKKPFFLLLNYNAPHFGKGWDGQNQKVVNIMQPAAADMRPNAKIVDPIRAQFAAMVKSLDDGIGSVLKTLETEELADNTLVIFMTDNGGDPKYGGSNAPYRGNKATLYEGGIRVPCVMRWPGHIGPGQTTDEFAGAIDLFPTLCQLSGVDATNEQMDGRSLLPIFRGERQPVREMYWEIGAHQRLGRKPWTALRKGEWKIVTAPDSATALFNLANDPHEANDLAATTPAKLLEMRKAQAKIEASFDR